MRRSIVPAIIFVGAISISIWQLGARCSLLSNDSGPFFNCLQDLQGYEQLCCWDFDSVERGRVILLLGTLLSVASGVFLARQRKNYEQGSPL